MQSFFNKKIETNNHCFVLYKDLMCVDMINPEPYFISSLLGYPNDFELLNELNVDTVTPSSKGFMRCAIEVCLSVDELKKILNENKYNSAYDQISKNIKMVHVDTRDKIDEPWKRESIKYGNSMPTRCNLP